MAFVLKIGYRQMVDIKLWAYAEHVNPMPHGGFDVTHHIPILDHPAKEPTHTVSPSCESRTTGLWKWCNKRIPFWAIGHCSVRSHDHRRPPGFPYLVPPLLVRCRGATAHLRRLREPRGDRKATDLRGRVLASATVLTVCWAPRRHHASFHRLTPAPDAYSSKGSPAHRHARRGTLLLRQRACQ